MTTIRVTCSDCGDIELAVEDMKVRVCDDTDDAQYRFTCTSCLMVTVKSAEPRTLELLASAGVHISNWKLPAELQEIHDGLVISHDDILEFHALLEHEETFAAAVAALEVS